MHLVTYYIVIVYAYMDTFRTLCIQHVLYIMIMAERCVDSTLSYVYVD